MMHGSSVSDKLISSQREDFAGKKTGYEYSLLQLLPGY